MGYYRTTKKQRKDQDRIMAWLNNQPFRENSRDRDPQVPDLSTMRVLEEYVPPDVSGAAQFFTPMEMGAAAISQYSTLPVLSNVHLSANGDGSMAVSGTNLAIGIRTWIAAEVTEPGEITAPIRTFGDLVALLRDTITMTTNGDAPTLKVECGRTRANVKGIPASEFVLIPDYPALRLTNNLSYLVINPVELERALSRTVFSAAKAAGRPTLEAVYLHTADGHLALASADGFRFSMQHLPGTPMTSFPNLMLPRSSLQEVQRLLANETESVQIIVNQGCTQAAFIFSNTHLVTQLVEGSFPDFATAIPDPDAYNLQITTSPAALQRALKSALVFSGSYMAHLTQWQIADANSIIITGADTETGDQATTLTASVEGDLDEKPFEFALNGRFVLDVLSALRDSVTEVQINLVNPTHPITFRGVGDDTYTHVIMPMHIGR